MTTQNGCYTTNGEGRIVVVVVLRDADAPVHFLRLTSVPALHLPISHTNSTRTLTSIASPGLNGSKSIVLLAFSAASFDSSRISALALSLTAIARPLPFVWFLQFNVFRIRFDVEWERADVIWRPLLRTLFPLCSKRARTASGVPSSTPSVRAAWNNLPASRNSVLKPIMRACWFSRIPTRAAEIGSASVNSFFLYGDYKSDSA